MRSKKIEGCLIQLSNEAIPYRCRDDLMAYCTRLTEIAIRFVIIMQTLTPPDFFGSIREMPMHAKEENLFFFGSTASDPIQFLDQIEVNFLGSELFMGAREGRPGGTTPTTTVVCWFACITMSLLCGTKIYT